MATISIGFRNADLGAELGTESGEDVVVIARAVQLLDDRMRTPDRPERREMMLPVARDYQFDGPPGLWGVEVVMPSGALMTDQVEVGASAGGRFEFDLGGSPHEWLAWQHLEGSVPERDAYRAIHDRGDAAGLVGVPRGIVPRGGSRRLAAGELKSFTKVSNAPVVETDPFAWSTRSAAKNISQVTLLREEVVPADRKEFQAADRARSRWSTLVAALRLEGDVLELEGIASPTDEGFRPVDQDAWHDLWRLAPASGCQDRRYALVVTSRSIELASLPLPWRVFGPSGDREILELVIDKSDVARPSRTSVTLRDPSAFTLLAYLKSGSLALASRVAEGDGDSMLVRTLDEKRSNPLAAAAAGYALLGAADLTEPREWHPWLANLAAWFDWLPDGAVLEGRRLMLAGGAGSEAAALKAFLLAFRRGLPFYTLGLTWLLDGLRRFPADEEARKAAELVRQVALRADMGQVFTTMSLSAPTEVTDDV